jgi:hypothetical protein
MSLLPLRVWSSSACRRVRRESAPAGGSLSFVASNESNQSKDALHFAVPLRGLPSATCHPRSTSDHGTPVQRTPPLGSLRIAIAPDAKRGGIGDVCAANDRIALRAPWGASRSAGVWGRVRSTLRQLTSRGCLSAAAAGREASSARGPKHRAPQSSPALAGPPPSGRLSFGSFSLAKQRKGTALSGAHPDAASRSEHEPHANAGTGTKGTRLRYLSLSAWWCADLLSHATCEP